MKTNLLVKTKKIFNKVKLSTIRNAPEILVVTGVVGLVGSAILACIETRKVDAIVEKTKDNLTEIHDNQEQMDQKEVNRLTTKVYVNAALEFGKIYAVPFAVGTASVVSILCGNGILRKRNTALGAAYAVVDSGFKNYRAKVIEKFGDEVDKELRYNIQTTTEKEKVKDIETGKDKNITVTTKTAALNQYSDYARVFDCGCAGWTKDPEQNLMFLRYEQTYATELLHRKGYLFLNEVYDRLGFRRTVAGQSVGWVDDPNGDGDTFVDFGIYDLYNKEHVKFINGEECSIILDFNVQGDILNKFTKYDTDGVG